MNPEDLIRMLAGHARTEKSRRPLTIIELEAYHDTTEKARLLEKEHKAAMKAFAKRAEALSGPMWDQIAQHEGYGSREAAAAAGVHFQLTNMDEDDNDDDETPTLVTFAERVAAPAPATAKKPRFVLGEN